MELGIELGILFSEGTVEILLTTVCQPYMPTTNELKNQ